MLRPSAPALAVAFALFLLLPTVQPLQAPLPAPAGAPGILAPGAEVVTILRDGYGVPHVFGETAEGVSFAAGYAMAKDRLFQGDLFRRSGKGTLSELLGASYAASDRAWRTTHYSEPELQRMFDSWEEPFKGMLRAYAQGWNLHLAEALADPVNKLPFEYAALGVPPEPWDVTDSVAIIVLMVDTYGQGGGSELRNLALLDALVTRFGLERGWAAFGDLKWMNDPGAPVTVPREGGGGDLDGAPYSNPGPKPPAYVVDLLKTVKVPQAADEFEEGILRPLRERLERVNLPHFGSNAFLVAPARSASGSALLYGGPQVGYNVPGLFTEMGLHGGGIDAVGISFAGVGPCVPIGAGPDHAWTTTSGVSDNIDLVAERIRRDPAEPKEFQSWFKGAWTRVQNRSETLLIHQPPLDVTAPFVSAVQKLPAIPSAPPSGPPPAQALAFNVWRTVHGPIVVGDPARLAPGEEATMFVRQLAYWFEDLGTAGGFCRYQAAESMEDLIRATDLIVSSHNLFFSDSNGNVVFWHAGKYPARDEIDADVRLPRLGDGSHEYTRFLALEEKPHAANPAQGWLANWNNKPSPEWDNGDGANYGTFFRVRDPQDKLRELSSGGDRRISLEELADVGRDAAQRDHRHAYFARYFAEARERARALGDERAAAAAALVLEWDGLRADRDKDGKYDAPGRAILREWYNAARSLVFADDLGGDLVGHAAESTLLHALEGPRSTLPVSRDYLNGRSRADVSFEALRSAMATLESRSGSPDPASWRDAVEMTTFVPFGGWTVPKIPTVDRGTYVQIVETGRGGPLGWSVNPPGEDGLLSAARFARMQAGESPARVNPHLMDQRELYATWTYKPMLLTTEQVLTGGVQRTDLVYVKT